MGNTCMTPSSYDAAIEFHSGTTATDTAATTSTTAAFDYIAKGLEFNAKEINNHRSRNFQSLLHRKKLHLVLDLDHTLVNSFHLDKLTLEQREELETRIIIENDTFKIDENIIVKLRPRVRNFLQEVSKMFDLSIYTLGSRYYATKVAEYFVDVPFRWIISREDCTTAGQKGLDVVLERRKVVLIVDDKERTWKEGDKGNIIGIKSYSYSFGWEVGPSEEDDGELERVYRVLKEVHSRFYDEAYEGEIRMKDVTQVLRGVMAMKDNELTCLSRMC